MNTISLRDGTVIGDAAPLYIIAELNTSHFGSTETAKRMIDEAKKAGCSCVKFQSWSAESLYSKTYYKTNPIAERFVRKFSFSEAELLEMVAYCNTVGIAFSSTPYSRAEVDFLLEKCQAPFVKVASMELNNYPFLEYIARTGAPIVLSTGMGDTDEIQRAVETITSVGNSNICLLHCISIYPPELSTIRLKNITGLQEMFPDFPIGFSDHSIGTEMASAAVALGACLIEKHLTLDNKRIGMDNQVASEPEEMAALVRNCRNVQTALGDKKRIVLPAELKQRENMRRSVIVTRDIKAGSRLTAEDLDAKRPGTGIPPSKMKELIGKAVLRDIEADTLVIETDIETK